MAEKIRIVLPDTGPLITLAHANALEVLLAFDAQQVQLVVTDMVEFEATSCLLYTSPSPRDS